MLWLFAARAVAGCTETITVADNPVSFDRTLRAGETICINSSRAYLSVVLNEWTGMDVYTHVYRRTSTESHGPYTDSGPFSGFDFGGYTGSIDIHVQTSGKLSLGAVAFDPKTHLRVISNHPKDWLRLDSGGSDYIEITRKQMIQYFNAAVGEKVYEVDMDTLPTDYLEFTGMETSERHTGKREFRRTIASSVSELVSWRCNSTTGLSDHVIMRIETKGLKRKKYVRMVSNGNKYYEIRWFKYETLTAGDIAGIVIGSIALLVIIVAGIVTTFYCVRKRRCKRRRATLKTVDISQETDDTE